MKCYDLITENNVCRKWTFGGNERVLSQSKKKAPEFRDLFQGKKFDDRVAILSWPIDGAE